MKLPPPAMELDHLNDSQREAVRCTEGPVLVLAGAGSGKTRVITHRVAYLLELGIPPEQIVALSFTNKAAGEMRQRLAAMVGPDLAQELVLSTFHSLGAQMLRTDPDGFGIDGGRFTILDQGDVFGVVRSLLRECGIHGGDRRFDVPAVAQHISLWKNDLLVPEAVAKQRLSGEYELIAARIYGPYQERLQGLGAVDFDDLVSRIALRLEQDPEVRARWQRRFAYFMVDEYQDTNKAQFEMVRLLVGERRNLCVVGDDDQAIYGWRGASITNILGFEKSFPGAQAIKLEHNYRSRPPILECANATIECNRLRHAKTLRPSKAGGEAVTHVVASDHAQEAQWVGKQIRNLIKHDRVPPSEIAVLYRSAAQTRPIEEELQQQGIPYRVLGGQAFYDKKEVKDALAYLKVLVTPRDELALRRALETPSRGIGAKTINRLQAHARDRGIRLVDAVHEANRIDDIAPQARRSLAGFSERIRVASARARERGSVSEALSSLLDDVELRNHVRKEVGSDEAADARWSGVSWLLQSVQRWEQRMQGQGVRPRWYEYLGKVALEGGRQNEDDPVIPSGEVTLATLHSAKGLEWDQVLLIGCEEGRLPHHRVSNPRASDAIAGDLEEERRLFYVGITRARERLWLTRAAHRIERGKEVPRTPSRFLAELPDAVRRYEITAEEELSSDDIGAMADAFLSRIRSEA